MAVTEVAGQPWTRKHDNPSVPVVPAAPITAYPTSLAECIALCRGRAAHDRMHAAGSHWALSEAAISDRVFIETHDRNNVQPAMGHTLYEVVPGCLTKDFVNALGQRPVPPFNKEVAAENAGFYPVHFETGKRIYQAYAELDQGDTDQRSLASLLAKRGFPSYQGPWAFRTLGGAGGQTVWGALTTGTHGGDFRMPPIADSVLAVHLVAHGGHHYWIEPESLRCTFGVRLTETDCLRKLYGTRELGGLDNFSVVRDDTLFDAVLVSAGRFGIVYSIVIAAVRQYSLHEERRLRTWEELKGSIGDLTNALYTAPAQNRFLQIAISVTPSLNFASHIAGVTKRWNVPMVESATSPGHPAGRAERVGRILETNNPRIGGPRFEFAGNSFPYSPDPSRPGAAQSANFLERACTNGNFMQGVIDETIGELRDFINSNGTTIGAGIAAATALGAGPLLVSLIPFLAIIVAVLAALLSHFATDTRFGQVLDDVRSSLLDTPDPTQRLAGLFVWHVIVAKAFQSQQENHDFGAISYAVMDGHDYLDQSCQFNVDSIEVFFDSADPMLVAWIDGVLNFEIMQEVVFGRAMVGYASLRFMGRGRALLAPQKFEHTCVVEVAGLRDVAGTTELVDFALLTALDSNYRGILHWGQRNTSDRASVQVRFGDDEGSPGGPLARWRGALSRITENGRLDGFSSSFSRRTGLEVVTPVINSVNAAPAIRPTPLSIAWDCTRNPPSTEVDLSVRVPSGATITRAGLPLTGTENIAVNEAGMHQVQIAASLLIGGIRRRVTQTQAVMVT